MAIAVRYVLPLVLCQLVVPVVLDFSREVTGTRRLEMEDASAQGAMVNSTLGCDVTVNSTPANHMICHTPTEGVCKPGLSMHIL
jgi:hypothetical protein